MSKVQLQGNASGTGIFTIASPNSNTDRTLTLPDSSGTLATTAAGSVTRTMLGSLGAVDLVAQTVTTGSSDGSISFNNVFTSAYKSYFIVLNLKLPGAGANDLYLRYRNAGSDINTSYGYQVSFYASDTYGINFTTNAGTATTYYIYDNMGSGPLTGVIEMGSPGTTSELKGAQWSTVSWDSRPKTCIGNGMRSTNGTYDGFTLFTGDGNGIGAGSVVSVYGRY